MNETFLSDTDLAVRFSVSRQTVWRWHRSNSGFPRAVSLSPGCTRWKLSEIEIWENRLAEVA
ncbi:AlpA family phage regulatory protein [Aliiroseovarius sp. F20344]|uniref:helix-turn-helix transcriptional regulator n=1 Tax=Aliiroseovarius sp. F20344 TaxID=2926414 RepID=UPI001FF5C260|nr:AlpA family phage regulatory protein [Aliiroseovarius sp. F20344]MCK0142994.1 AlpA family phage regulatory protein [Aliiroseovarius sp. F20344]